MVETTKKRQTKLIQTELAGIRGLSQWETNKFPEKDERINSDGDKKRWRDRERGQKMETWKWNNIYIEQDQRERITNVVRNLYQ
jgi:hypothetical protein